MNRIGIRRLLMDFNQYGSNGGGLIQAMWRLRGKEEQIPLSTDLLVWEFAGGGGDAPWLHVPS
jgi:hypothetical protein